MADANPPENGSAAQTANPTAELNSTFLQDPLGFAQKAAKKLEDLATRGVAEEQRQLLQASKTVRAVVTDFAMQANGLRSSAKNGTARRRKESKRKSVPLMDSRQATL